MGVSDSDIVFWVSSTRQSLTGRVSDHNRPGVLFTHKAESGRTDLRVWLELTLCYDNKILICLIEFKQLTISFGRKVTK